MTQKEIEQRRIRRQALIAREQELQKPARHVDTDMPLETDADIERAASALCKL